MHTVLGETSDPCELFLVDACNSLPLEVASQVAHIIYKPPSRNGVGDEELDKDNHFTDDGKSFFYQMHYNAKEGRFEDVPADPPCLNAEKAHRFCVSCERGFLLGKRIIPTVGELKMEENREVMFLLNFIFLNFEGNHN